MNQYHIKNNSVMLTNDVLIYRDLCNFLLRSCVRATINRHEILEYVYRVATCPTFGGTVSQLSTMYLNLRLNVL